MRTRTIHTGVAAVLVATLATGPAFGQQPPPPPSAPPAQAAPPSAQASPPQPAPPPSTVPAPTPAQLQERRLHVNVDSTKDSTVVERRVSVEEGNGTYIFLPYHSATATWEQVCVTPCNVDLDRYSSYRVGALNHVAGSKTFTLPQSGNDLHLQVQAGDAFEHHVGQALTGAGLTALIVGVVLVAAAHAFTDESDVRVAGFITGGAGIVVMAVGIPVTILTATHVVTQGSRIALTPRGLTF